MSQPQQWDFDLYQGADFTAELPVYDPTGKPANLTGYTGAMQVVDPETGAVRLDLSSGNGRLTGFDTKGLITLALRAVDTGAVAAGGEYDLQVRSPAGVVTVLYRGAVRVTPRVTQSLA